VISRSKGYTAERELVIKLWRLGFAVMRAPASGAKIKKAKYPDVVAIKSGKVLIFEVKSRSKLGSIYLHTAQIQKLREFAERASGVAYIAIRLPGSEWRFIPLEALEKVSESRYRISKELITGAETLDELLRRLKLIRTLDDFLEGSI